MVSSSSSSSVSRSCLICWFAFTLEPRKPVGLGACGSNVVFQTIGMSKDCGGLYLIVRIVEYMTLGMQLRAKRSLLKSLQPLKIIKLIVKTIIFRSGYSHVSRVSSSPVSQNHTWVTPAIRSLWRRAVYSYSSGISSAWLSSF